MGINFGEIKNSITNHVGMANLKIRNASPEIFLGLGIVTMVGAVVAGAMAARNHDDIVADHNDRLTAAKAETVIKVDEESSEEVEVVREQKEINAAVRKCYVETGFAFVKNYALTGALMGLSTFCFCEMHNIQAGRIAGLTGAYTGLQEYIKRYEDNNIKLNGEESHRMCKYGFKEVEVEEEDPDNGEKYKTTKKVAKDASDLAAEGIDSTFHDQFAEFSRQTTPSYTGRADMDLMHLQNAQNYIIDRMNAFGFATVNDARAELNLPPTEEGINEGWVRGCGPDPDFGFEDPVNNRCLAGYPNEPWLLEFNIHGNLNWLLKKKREKKDGGNK